MKWIAVAGGVVLIGLLLLWREVRSGDEGARPAAAAKRPAEAAEAGELPVRRARKGEEDPQAREVRLAGTLAPDDQSGPVTKYSEEFWERIDEVYSRRLLEFAAPCYSGKGENRKAKLKIAFRYDITEGAVAVKDAHMIESTLIDKRVEQCMMRELAKAAFKDPRMPDWSSSADEEETLVIRIETLKRFGPETD